MKTGSHLRIKSMGSAVLGVELKGNPKQPEPIHFRVVLPFGDVDITRCTDGSYWVHVRRNTEEQVQCDIAEQVGQFIDGRIDVTGKHASDCDAGDFGHPDMDHMAVRIGPKPLTSGGNHENHDHYSNPRRKPW